MHSKSTYISIVASLVVVAGVMMASVLAQTDSSKEKITPSSCEVFPAKARLLYKFRADMLDGDRGGGNIAHLPNEIKLAAEAKNMSHNDIEIENFGEYGDRLNYSLRWRDDDLVVGALNSDELIKVGAKRIEVEETPMPSRCSERSVKDAFFSHFFAGVSTESVAHFRWSDVVSVPTNFGLLCKATVFYKRTEFANKIDEISQLVRFKIQVTDEGKLLVVNPTMPEWLLIQ